MFAARAGGHFFLAQHVVEALEDGAQATLFVHDDEDGAVDEEVVGRGALGLLGVEDGELEAVHGELHEVGFRAGEEMPAVRVCTEALRVGSEGSRGVVLGVGGEGDELDGSVRREGGLQLAHALGHRGAGAGAAAEDDVGDPDLTAQVGEADGAVKLVGEGEVGDLSDDGEFRRGGALTFAHVSHSDGEHHEDDAAPDGPLDEAGLRRVGFGGFG